MRVYVDLQRDVGRVAANLSIRTMNSWMDGCHGGCHRSMIRLPLGATQKRVLMRMIVVDLVRPGEVSDAITALTGVVVAIGAGLLPLPGMGLMLELLRVQVLPTAHGVPGSPLAPSTVLQSSELVLRLWDVLEAVVFNGRLDQVLNLGKVFKASSSIQMVENSPRKSWVTYRG